MTDLAELKRLAQSIFANPIRNPDNSAFWDAANPATILSLIQRVEEAEVGKERANYFHAIDPPKTTDPNGLASWLSRNEASSIGSMAGVLAGLISDARLAGIEEALRAMQSAPCDYDGHAEGHVENMTRARCVQAIRALKEKA